MTFAHGIKLSEAKEAVKGYKEFRVKEDAEQMYAVVNYDFCHNGTFPSLLDDVCEAELRKRQILRECRGLVFCLRSGEVIARRFHKFFNVGERDECDPSRIDTNKGFVLLNKLDGQLVSPFIVASGLRWGTKMCITAKEHQVESCFTNYKLHYNEFAEHWLVKGVTPLFEWCSPLSPIVIKSPTHKLTLTAMRENISGRYFTYDELTAAAADHGIDVVEPLAVHEEGMSVADTLAKVKAMPDIEGCVMVLPDGNMYKMKTNWYFARARRMKESGFNFQRDDCMWQAVLGGTLDDEVPSLPDNMVRKVQAYATYLWDAIASYADRLHPLFASCMETLEAEGRKAFVDAVSEEDLSPFERKLLLASKKRIVYASVQDFLDQTLKPALIAYSKGLKPSNAPPGIVLWSQVMLLSDDDCTAELSRAAR